MSEETASSVEEQGTDGADELAPGTELLQGQYKITEFLNAGGFGITYRAKDSLERPIVIKECFPGAFCRRSRAIVQARSRAHKTEFASIVRHFVEEAKSLAKLDHPNIVGVHQVWEENDTAYMALDFVEGRDLLDIIEDEALVTSLTPAQVENILRQVLDAIGFVHGQDMLHRDISPDNILVRPDLTPVLIDFGAARQQVKNENKVLSALRVVKDGYSPQEFYVTGSEQGPYSDLYALGASFYHVITGEAPPDSQTRLSAIATGTGDPYQALEGRIDGFSPGVMASIDAALKVLPKERIQSATDWVSMMDGTLSAPVAAAPAAASDTVAPAVQAAQVSAGSGGSKAGLMIGVAVVALAAAGIGGYATGMFGGGDEVATAELDTPVTTSASTSEGVATTDAKPVPAQDTAAVDTDTQVAAASENVSETRADDEVIATVAKGTAPVADGPAETPTPDTALAGALAVEETRPWPADAEQSLAETMEEIEAANLIAGAPETSGRPTGRPGTTLVAGITDGDAARNTDDPVQASLIEEEKLAPTNVTETEDAAVAGILLPQTPEVAPETESQSIEGRFIGLNSQDTGALASIPEGPQTPDALDTASVAADRDLSLPAQPVLQEPGFVTQQVTAMEGRAVRPALGDAPAVAIVPEAPVNPGSLSVAAIPETRTLALPDLPATPRASIGAEAQSLGEFAPLSLPAVIEVEVASVSREIAEDSPQNTGGWTRTVTVEAPPFGAEILSASAASNGSEPATETNFVQTTWVVSLPFSDLRADQDGSLWIRSVEGLPVQRRDDLNAVLRQMYDLSGVDEVSLSLGLGQRNGDPMLEQVLTLPVVQETVLPNGLRFEARAEDGKWVTRVTEVPSGMATDLREGDIMFAHVETGERLEGRTSLPDLLKRELLAGQSNFNFAVERNGNVWLALLNSTGQ